jgi:hypothetical protein
VLFGYEFRRILEQYFSVSSWRSTHGSPIRAVFEVLCDRKEPGMIALRSIDVVQQLFLRQNPDLGEIVNCLSYELLSAECLN